MAVTLSFANVLDFIGPNADDASINTGGRMTQLHYLSALHAGEANAAAWSAFLAGVPMSWLPRGAA